MPRFWLEQQIGYSSPHMRCWMAGSGFHPTETLSLDIKLWLYNYWVHSRDLGLKYNLGSYCHMDGISTMRSDEIPREVSREKRIRDWALRRFSIKTSERKGRQRKKIWEEGTISEVEGNLREYGILETMWKKKSRKRSNGAKCCW